MNGRVLARVFAGGAIWLALCCAAATCSRLALAETRDELLPEPSPGSLNELLAVRGSSLKFRGAASCAAVSCHGSPTADPRPGNIRRDEYIFWIERDPHSQAYQSLSDDRSLAMLRRLKIADHGQILDQAGFANCVACHDPRPPSAQRFDSYYTPQGVSCEICHGPSEHWLADHYRLDWNKSQAAALGMVNTDNLLQRARLCAECHVGSPGREVNHDLIAAGHPVLRFELGAYHRILPKHWDNRAERAARQEFEVQLWAAGQVASAEASVKLLAARAARAAAGRPGVWPELAEYDCYACHHDLDYPNWTRERGFAQRPRGMAAWGSWYFGLLERAAEQEESAPAEELANSMRQVRATMEASFRSQPDRVRDQSQRMLNSLQAWSQQTPDLGQSLQHSVLNPLEVKELRVSLIRNWDTAAQFYLALVACDRAYRDELKKTGRSWPSDHELHSTLVELLGQIAFRKGYDSPRLFSARGDPSKRSTRSRVRQLVDRATQILRERGPAKP